MESLRLSFRCEAFNLLNLANFVAAAANRDAANFGMTSGTVANARIMQFALKGLVLIMERACSELRRTLIRFYCRPTRSQT